MRNVRQRFVEKGLDAALERKKQSAPSRKRILDGEKEARLLAIGCSEPPQGHSRRTLHLLAQEMDCRDSLSIQNLISEEENELAEEV